MTVLRTCEKGRWRVRFRLTLRIAFWIAVIGFLYLLGWVWIMSAGDSWFQGHSQLNCLEKEAHRLGLIPNAGLMALEKVFVPHNS